MKAKRLFAGLVAALCLLAAGCGEAGSGAASGSSPASGSEAVESDVAYIQDKGTLVVGITEFAPMDYKDENGEWIGFDAEMARAIGDALGVEVQFTVIEWGNKLLELDNKSIDCVWNGMTITDEVTNGASVTNAYAKNAQVVVMPADKAGDYPDAASMTDLLVAVEEGSAGEDVALEQGFDTVPVLDQASALMEVSAGTSDACVIDLLMAGAMIGEGTSYPDLVRTVELSEEDYGVGCRKGSDLTAFINEQFVTLYENGTTQQLAEKYGIADNIVAQS